MSVSTSSAVDAISSSPGLSNERNATGFIFPCHSSVYVVRIVSSCFSSTMIMYAMAIYHKASSISSRFVSQSSPGSADSSTIHTALPFPIRAAAFITPWTAAATSAPTVGGCVMIFGIYVSPFSPDRYWKTLYDWSPGMARGIHSIINREIATNKIGTHSSIFLC